MVRKLLLVFIGTIASCSAFSQEDSTAVEESVVEEMVYEEDTNSVTETFLGTRIINGHSVETLHKGVLEFRVEHRFGDMGGTNGGAQNFYGLDNSADIRLALEYGITDKFMVGLGRSKGTGNPWRSLIDGFGKYRVLTQEKRGIPFSLSVLGEMSYTYMRSSDDIYDVTHFSKESYRMAYCTQLHFARKFGEKLSLAVIPSLVHRNYVAQDDVNTIFAVGGALRYSFTSTMAILLEYYHVIDNNSYRPNNTNSFGVAYEWKTFGHNFTINLTNSKGFGETQFIPYTYEKWDLGEFRLGFCISRKFERE